MKAGWVLSQHVLHGLQVVFRVKGQAAGERAVGSFDGLGEGAGGAACGVGYGVEDVYREVVQPVGGARRWQELVSGLSAAG
jgi:hypothetical protein